MLFILLSCGVNTRDWPRIDLPFNESDLYKATIDYEMRAVGKNTETKVDYIEILSENALLELYYKIESFPYKKEKGKKINTIDYFVKIQIVLFYNDVEEAKEYIITFYSYGVTKGYIVLENGDIYYIPGDFATVIYERIEVE